MRRYFAAVSLSFLTGIFGLVAQSWNGWRPATVAAIPMTPESINRSIAYEHAQREIDNGTIVAARIFNRYGCDTRFARLAAESAVDSGLSVRLVTADIVVESSGRAGAISYGGAIGLMQILPSRSYSKKDLLDPRTNIHVGSHLLAGNIKKYGRREGVKRYFGVTEGSQASENYADRVFAVAGEN